MVVRLFPHYDVEKVWQYAEKRFSNDGNGGVVPLFMSEQDYQNHVSVICEVREIDALADFLAKEIAPCKEIVSTKTVTLLKPAFYPVPENAPDSLCRFLVPLRIHPNYIASLHEKMLKLYPPEGVYFAYVALSLGDEDMIVSLLANDRDAVTRFVAGRIEDIGIQSLRIGVTHRTKRLVGADAWMSCQKKYARSRLLGGTVTTEDYSFDWTRLNRCCVHGLPHE